MVLENEISLNGSAVEVTKQPCPPEDSEYALDVADRMAGESDMRCTHDEVFSDLKERTHRTVGASVKPRLIHESSGKTLSVRQYEYGSYSIKVVCDGVDTVTSAMPKNGVLPSLSRESGVARLEFPMRGYQMEYADEIIQTIRDLKEIGKLLDELV